MLEYISRITANHDTERIIIMKKIVSALLAFALVIGMVLSLASCNMLSGTYSTTIPIVGTEIDLTFKGNKVTVKSSTSILGAADVVTEDEATYKIGKNDEGKTTITFTYAEGEDGNDTVKGTQSFEKGTDENGDSYIKIGGVKFTKK